MIVMSLSAGRDRFRGILDEGCRLCDDREDDACWSGAFEDIRARADDVVLLWHVDAEVALEYLSTLATAGSLPANLKGIVVFRGMYYAGVTRERAAEIEKSAPPGTCLHVLPTAIHPLNVAPEVSGRIRTFINALRNGKELSAAFDLLTPASSPQALLGAYLAALTYHRFEAVDRDHIHDAVDWELAAQQFRELGGSSDFRRPTAAHQARKIVEDVRKLLLNRYVG